MVAGFDNEGGPDLGGVLSFALVLNVGVEPVVVISCVGHLRGKQCFYLFGINKIRIIIISIIIDYYYHQYY